MLILRDYLDSCSDLSIDEDHQKKIFVILQKFLMVFLPSILMVNYFFKEDWSSGNWIVLLFLTIIIFNIIFFEEQRSLLVNREVFQLLALLILDFCVYMKGEINGSLSICLITWVVINTFILSCKQSVLYSIIFIVNLLCISWLMPSIEYYSWLYNPLRIILFSFLLQSLITFSLYGYRKRIKNATLKIQMLRDYEKEILLENAFYKGEGFRKMSLENNQSTKDFSVKYKDDLKKEVLSLKSIGSIDITSFVEETFDLAEILFFKKKEKCNFTITHDGVLLVYILELRALLFFLYEFLSDESICRDDSSRLFFKSNANTSMTINFKISESMLISFKSTALYRSYFKNFETGDVSFYQILNLYLFPLNGRLNLSMRNEFVFISLFIPEAIEI